MLDVYGEIFRTRAGGKLEKTAAIEAQVPILPIQGQFQDMAG